ncbi:TraK family protein [Maridesulfovibrio ferrireducens]|uniref:TraK family protein n=1 Tax=Maridesulfovibrio ferrireducens TaxID=246191 RepID=UPI00244E9836|nr:TraK family protein [Maridesulfovibrio ferrireducens]
MRVQVPLWVPRLNQGFTCNLTIACGPFFYAIFLICPTPVPPISNKTPFQTTATALTAALFSCVQRHISPSTYISFINKTKRSDMISKITPSKNGIGRVQYLSLKADIESNLIAGHTRIAIHNHYADQGKITFSYKRFCHYVNRYSSHCLQKKQGLKPSPILSAASLPAKINSSVQLEQSQKFSHEKNPSNEKIKDLT